MQSSLNNMVITNLMQKISDSCILTEDDVQKSAKNSFGLQNAGHAGVATLCGILSLSSKTALFMLLLNTCCIDREGEYIKWIH